MYSPSSTWVTGFRFSSLTLVLLAAACEPDTLKEAPPRVEPRTTSRGTELWFAFMENLSLEGNGPPRFSVFIDAPDGATGSVDLPRRGLSIPFTASASELLEVPLPSGVPYGLGSDVVTDFGFRITSDRPVHARIVHFRLYFSDASIVLPMAELSTSYIAMAVEDFDRTSPSELVVVATEDDTEVEITPSGTTLGYRPAGTPFRVRLDAGQTYQLQSIDDLSGTRFRANRRIAVFGGAKQADVGCAGADSHVFDEILPLERLGTTYAIVPFEGRGGDVIKFVAPEDLDVRMGCDPGAEQFHMAAGEVVARLVSEPVRVLATAPVLVAQIARSHDCAANRTGDPSLLVLLPEPLTLERVKLSGLPVPASPQTAADPVSTADRVLAVAPPGSTVELDGTAYVTDASGAVTLHLGNGSHTLSAPGGVGVRSYGFGNYDGYTMSSGYDCVGCAARLRDVVQCP